MCTYFLENSPAGAGHTMRTADFNHGQFTLWRMRGDWQLFTVVATRP